MLFACFAVFAAVEASAQTALPSFGSSLAAHHTQAKLILSADSAKPGDTIWAGVDLKMEPDWHTYWKNPGAAGMATKSNGNCRPASPPAKFNGRCRKNFRPSR